MLRADDAVVQGAGLRRRPFQRETRVRRQAETRRPRRAEAVVMRDNAAQLLALQPLAAQDMRAETVLFLQDPEQQVLRTDIGVAEIARRGARGLDGDLRPLGEFFIAFDSSCPLQAIIMMI